MVMVDDGIQWIVEPGLFDLGYGVLFAWDLNPLELVSRVGGVVDSMRPMNRVDAHELELELKEDADDQIIRIGSHGGWAFAIAEHGAIGYPFFDVIRRVSVGTEAVS